MFVLQYSCISTGISKWNTFGVCWVRIMVAESFGVYCGYPLSWSEHRSSQPHVKEIQITLAILNAFSSSSFSRWGTPREPVPRFFARCPRASLCTSSKVGRPVTLTCTSSSPAFAYILSDRPYDILEAVCGRAEISNAGRSSLVVELPARVERWRLDVRPQTWQHRAIIRTHSD